MKVDLYQLTDEEKTFDFDIKQESFTKIDLSCKVSDSITCHLRVHRYEEQVFLRGSYQAELTTSCHYCLDEVLTKLNGDIDLTLVPEAREENLEDQEFSLSEQDKDYYSGTSIDLGYYMEDQVLLDLPVTILCNEDCKGICSQCGVNKNHQPCKCDGINPNSPFAVLKELKDKAD